MWKIIFTYPDGVKVKLTNSSIPMDKRLANKYYDIYGYNSVECSSSIQRKSTGLWLWPLWWTS